MDGSVDRRAPRAVVGCGALLALAAVGFALVTLLADRGHDDLAARWDDAFGSWEATYERWPSREANIEALELERRSAALGVELAPRHSGRNPADPAAAADFKAASAEIKKYVESEIESADRAVAPPPATVRSYLATYRTELDALRTRLTTGRGPRWQRKLENRYAAPIPNLMGQINLQRLLHSDALDAVAAGDIGRAHTALEASWRLNESLRDGPELISTLVAISVARSQSGVLRLTPDLPDIWIDRLEQRPHLPGVIEALTVESRLSTEMPMAATASPSTNAVGNAARFVAMPYARMCAADLGEEFLDRLMRLSTLEWVCDRDLAAVGADLHWEPPWWNRFGDLALSNLSSSIHRAARADLDAELTARLLRLGGSDPSGPSTVCPNDSWILVEDRDGRSYLELSRQPRWQRDSGPELPLRYEVPGR